MSTRSSITVQTAQGKFKTIYCHFDGYIDHHGPILLGHYNSQERAEALVAAGDIRSLERNLPGTRAIDVGTGDRACEVYPNSPPRTGDSLRSVFERQEYNYVWMDGEWFVGPTPDHLVSLTDKVTDRVTA